MTAREPTVDDYLARLPAEKRVALGGLRRMIKEAAPGAVETIRYRIPIFKYNGHFLVGFSAASDHCTFHLMSASMISAHKKELRDYPTGKGSVRFPADRPLPAALVKKLVKARIAEIVEHWGREG